MHHLCVRCVLSQDVARIKSVCRRRCREGGGGRRSSGRVKRGDGTGAETRIGKNWVQCSQSHTKRVPPARGTVVPSGRWGLRRVGGRTAGLKWVWPIKPQSTSVALRPSLGFSFPAPCPHAESLPAGLLRQTTSDRHYYLPHVGQFSPCKHSTNSPWCFVDSCLLLESTSHTLFHTFPQGPNLTPS